MGRIMYLDSRQCYPNPAQRGIRNGRKNRNALLHRFLERNGAAVCDSDLCLLGSGKQGSLRA